jgi:hypothetical protein
VTSALSKQRSKPTELITLNNDTKLMTLFKKRNSAIDFFNYFPFLPLFRDR